MSARHPCGLRRHRRPPGAGGGAAVYCAPASQWRASPLLPAGMRTPQLAALASLALLLSCAAVHAQDEYSERPPWLQP